VTDRNSGETPEKQPLWKLLAAAFLVLLGLGVLLVYTGAYNIAADSPHTAPVLSFLNTIRQRSVAVRAAGVVVPADIADPKRIAAGAGMYNEMCSGCHLGPGTERTEISLGLYPRAPDFSRGTSLTPGEEFWAIKHGIKMSGMAAWGPTHNDKLIWDMVAFLRKLPTLSPAQYQLAIKTAPKDHDEMMKDMKMDGSK
jgi:mono/diheme cytochrome c family protein